MPDAVSYLNSLPRFSGKRDDAFKPGLERMKALLAAMGDPHDTLRAVHVAGTNGKGSVAAFTRAIAEAAGATVVHEPAAIADWTERRFAGAVGHGRGTGGEGTGPGGVFGFATPSDVASEQLVVRVAHEGFNPRRLTLDGRRLAIDLRDALYGGA